MKSSVRLPYAVGIYHLCLTFFFFFHLSLWVLHVFLLDTKLLGNFNEIEKTASNDTEIFQNEVAIF